VGFTPGWMHGVMGYGAGRCSGKRCGRFGIRQRDLPWKPETPRPPDRGVALGEVLTTNSPQGPREEGLGQQKWLVQAMELAGLEPATSWVRSADLLRSGAARPGQSAQLRRAAVRSCGPLGPSRVSRVDFAVDFRGPPSVALRGAPELGDRVLPIRQYGVASRRASGQ
jgi:hypothetical protein